MKPLSSNLHFDIVVVGAGHAGIEASLASARMGCSTVLVTMEIASIGRMSCNPAIGGSAKGHLVREIDALGGEMGRIADATGIHFRMLNKSKGPAVWSPRCQSDREWYSREAASRVLLQKHLLVVEDTLEDIGVSAQRVQTVILESGRTIACKAIVVCSGTFLNGLMHTGMKKQVGGRYGERTSSRLAARLKDIGFKVGRLKTGTPPRISRKSVDFASTEPQHADSPPMPFSFSTNVVSNTQISMYLTHTNNRTHEILKSGFNESPMFTGKITGVGPRYCPSIEDKVHRFADKDQHQIFLEPEGYESEVVYVNGFSTSLPANIQLSGLQAIPGLERCVMLRAGYAVEYDFFPPFQLEHTLETKSIKGLFFAGQINGTSGYEEAAGQGLVAGINAALKTRGEDPLVLERSNSYIGVMVDDLINKGTDEPYRIFTSRAEYRLKLRQDNADSRLMRTGYKLGLVNEQMKAGLEQKEERIRAIKNTLFVWSILPNEANPTLHRKGLDGIAEPLRISQLLRRPGISIYDIMSIECVQSNELFREASKELLDRVEIEIKYEGYLKRQDQQIESFAKNEALQIPNGFNFSGVNSLSNEGKERLESVQPRSIGQASRISGVTSADLSVLIVSLRK
ncbi:MAG TPA: tRNA uridine-5-carboxymethylaminomethyl(34) synthesis enzyme MnmG [Bacteroidota bacterium]|nr:tRNA uridine-5-carboxymethylaminomethyl(34) synthesis enzyme MnmG [Bacteroidota bacterium]